MREIKFRVWDTSMGEANAKMRYFDLFDDARMVLSGFNDIRTVPIMQYTGLHDKNGKEIYDGDILTEDGNWFIPIEWIDNDTQPFGLAYYDSGRNYEVEGNIYENPNLLK